MSLLRRSHPFILATVVVGAAACASDDGTSLTSTSSTKSELDVIGLAERPASLLVLGPAATPTQHRRLEQTLARLGGGVLETLPPRLVVAQVPTGAETALSALGVVARFDRVVTGSDLWAATLPEERFLSVYASRWFPADVPNEDRLIPTRVPRPQGEVEAAPQIVPTTVRAAAAAAAIDPEDTVAVPFASGKVVVSIVLPESNGSIDASTEDWNETLIRETYLKVQAALDKISAADPNADLRFVLHYESSPATGGLLGTVDTGYEFGQRAQWGSSTEFLATADLLGQLLDREVAEGDVWTAALEYDAKLKRQYDADAAFFVVVAANGNYTAGLRAHAWIGGPWTVLDSSYGWEVFAHEFGHIYGALDEYCPDQCVPPTALTGYLGIYNANAASNPSGGGIDNGRGEAVTSLMEYNNTESINGFTRGAWGWLDTDGDGIIEVRDTLPKSNLTATVTGQRVRLIGEIVDRGDSRMFGGIRYSANRIIALEYAFDPLHGPWFRHPLSGSTRGRQAVNLEITGVRSGTRTLHVRGVNSVGNVEPKPQALTVTTAGTANSAPHLRLDVPMRAGNVAAITLTTAVRDLDGDSVQVRYDLDGNGTWDTTARAAGSYSFTPAAGLVTIRALATDARGATRTVSAELPVVRGAAAPTLALSPRPSMIHGVATGNVTMTATASSGATLNVITELLTSDDKFRQERPAGTGGQIAVSLPTPPSLRTHALDLTTGDISLAIGWVRDLVALDANTLLVAGGVTGLWILDITDRATPRVVSRLALETSANHFFKSGNFVYVLGTYLTVVDIRDRLNPHEIKQSRSVTGQVVGEVLDPIDVADGSEWPNQHAVSLVHGAKITSTRIDLTINHPRPADLKISLVASKDLRIEPIVLWDHRTAPGGTRNLTFTSSTTPALRALHGLFAEGFWTIQILDDQNNGDAGQLLSSRLQFNTSARAVKVIDNAAEIAGKTAAGSLVIAGSGLETLDVRNPAQITSQARLTGTGTQHATMTGDIAVLSMGLESKELSNPRLRGLCAVNVRFASSPQVIRCDTTSGEVYDHAAIGSRLYVAVMPMCDKDDESCVRESSTIVGDTARFAQGLAWKRGTSPLRIDRSSIGDDTRVWTVGPGYVQDLNVSNPAALAVRQNYPRSYAARLVPLRSLEMVLFQFSTLAQTTTLGDAQNILSRIYRMTVEARSAAGLVTRASRTVHVVPYNHAPNAATAAVVPGKGPGDPPRLRIDVTDPDGSPSWHTSVMARIDWDGDGAFDTDWYWLGYDEANRRFSSDFDLEAPAGTYAAVVDVRDGFWARYQQANTIVVPAR